MGINGFILFEVILDEIIYYYENVYYYYIVKHLLNYFIKPIFVFLISMPDHIPKSY